MISVEIQFTAGRYHANPWGRHVNEGSVEWPPSPWRFLRALVAVWRKQSRDDEVVLRALLSRLAPSPCFQLSPVTTGHSRHYLPTADIDRLALDCFVSCPHGITLRWADVTLEEGEGRLLDQLLSELTYFGRAESWCEARRCPQDDGTAHAYPLEPGATYQGDVVTLLCAEPEVTLEQLELTPAQMRRQRYNRPPGSRWVTFALDPVEVAPVDTPPRPTMAVFVVSSQRDIALQQTVKVADAVRNQLLSLAGDVHSPIFGGKVSGAPRADGHRHLHVLPEGEQGRLERVRLWAPGGFGPAEMDLLRKSLSIGSVGRIPAFSLKPWSLYVQAPTESSQRWISATPYLPSRHPKKDGRDECADQIATECALRGLPTPEVRPVGEAPAGWVIRRRGQAKPPGKGQLFELLFPTQVSGPLCLGANSHFGLGRFAPHQV
jgi:CRISPR-associated protein Csb2